MSNLLKKNNENFIIKFQIQGSVSIFDMILYVEPLNGIVDTKSQTILIPTGENEYDTYIKIKKLFDSLEIDLTCNQSFNNLLTKAQEEINKFELFSAKAKDIRNNNCDTEEFRTFQERLVKFRMIANEPLRAFQLLSAYHLAFSQNACNFSVPGAGKTSTVYAAYDFLKSLPESSNKHIDYLLIVAPLSAFYSWKDEYNKCFGSRPKALEIFGGIDKRIINDKLKVSKPDNEIYLINYQSLFTHENTLEFFLENNKVMMVLDEAHKIKKVDDGLWSSSVLRLGKYASSRVILTGTPAPNSYVDLYNLYKFIWPNHNIIGYSAGQLANMSSSRDERTQDLLNRISPFFIRIKKSDLNLPIPKYNEPVIIKMGPIQQKIYDAISDSNIPGLDRTMKTNFGLKSKLIRLRQAASNPVLLTTALSDYYSQIEDDYEAEVDLQDNIDVNEEIKDLIENYTKLEIPVKFIKTLEKVKEIIGRGEKVIIWTEFVKNITSLGKFLKDSEINNKLLYGAISKEEREDVIKEFHTNKSSFSVIIANPHAVGESISLHKACHNAIYMEMSHNAGTYMQSKDRIHRIGLKDSDLIQYNYIQTEGTVDEDILKNVLGKEKRMIELIEKEEIPLISDNVDFMDDTEDDIKAIIKSYYKRRNKLVL